MSAGNRAAEEFDRMAAAYASDERQPYNDMYERPAMLQIIGTLEGARVLELGCAGGAMTAGLASAGAQVTAVDVSSELVRLAQLRLGDAADVRVADIEAGCPFVQSGTVDLVVASLVLHYINDWLPVLREIDRVLVPGGRLVFSTHHPLIDYSEFDLPDYFAVTEIADRWTKGGQEFEVHFYHRPLARIFTDVAESGLVFESLAEPLPISECRNKFPGVYQKLSTRPWFLFMTARKPSTETARQSR